MMTLGTLPSLANTSSRLTVSSLPTTSQSLVGRYFSTLHTNRTIAYQGFPTRMVYRAIYHARDTPFWSGTLIIQHQKYVVHNDNPNGASPYHEAWSVMRWHFSTNRINSSSSCNRRLFLQYVLYRKSTPVHSTYRMFTQLHTWLLQLSLSTHL